MSILSGINAGSLAQPDIADLFPEPARAKFLAIKQTRDDSRAIARPIFQQIEDKRTERRSHADRLKQLLGAVGEGGFSLAPEAAQCVDVEKSIAKLDAEIARLRSVYDMRCHHSDQLADLTRNLETYARAGRPAGTMFAPVAIEAPTIKKTETLPDAVEGCRRKLREFDAAAHAIESAPLPSSVARAHMRQQVDQWASAGQPSVEQTVWLGADVTFPTTTLTSEVRAEQLALAFTEAVSPICLLAWFAKDQLIARLDAEIMATCDDENAMRTDERAKRLAVIAVDRLATERTEEALITQAETQGQVIVRRPDADPRAVLQIELISTAASRSGPLSVVRGLIGG